MIKCSTIVHLFFISIYADDSNRFYTHSDLQHLEQNVNRELNEISLWLRVNVAKTHFVIFHPHQKKINNSLKTEIDGRPINQHKSVKYLAFS